MYLFLDLIIVVSGQAPVFLLRQCLFGHNTSIE